MTTNPSTGLPEELEKIVQPILQTSHDECEDPWYSCAQSETCVRPDAGGDCGCGMEEANRLRRQVLRDVLDWACKRVCVGCRAGIPVEWFAGHQYVSNFGPVDDVFLHHNEDGYADCAASVLREGLK